MRWPGTQQYKLPGPTARESRVIEVTSAARRSPRISRAVTPAAGKSAAAMRASNRIVDQRLSGGVAREGTAPVTRLLTDGDEPAGRPVDGPGTGFLRPDVVGEDGTA